MKKVDALRNFGASTYCIFFVAIQSVAMCRLV